jgi:trehalose/maltose hydrolase-like predicted phosphorylase
LRLLPCRPSAWTELRLPIRLRGRHIQVLLHRAQSRLETSGEAVPDAARPVHVAPGEFDALAATNQLVLAPPLSDL